MKYYFSDRPIVNCFIKTKWIVGRSGLKRYKYHQGVLSNIGRVKGDNVSENSRYYFEEELKGRKYLYVSYYGIL